MPRWLTFFLLCFLCLFLFFYGIHAGELWRTESLRAIIAADFLKTGNWVVPTLYGQPLFTKPPGMYAAIALVSSPMGQVSEWTARLPSALAATATVLLFYWYFRRQLGAKAGLIAAIVLPLSLMWLDKASAAEIDMLQVAWVSGAILFFLRALEEEKVSSGQRAVDSSPGPVPESAPPDAHCPLPTAHSSLPTTHSSLPTAHSSLPTTHYPLSTFFWMASLLCVAGGLLTKWTAPAFFYGTIIPLLWWRGQLRLLFGKNHLLSAGIAALICLGWITTAAAMTGWDTFYQTVSQEAAMRLLPSHHHRPYPIGAVLLHPLKIFAACLPISFFALWAMRPSFARLWDERGQMLLQALHCWVWPNLLFWTIIPEKAARHSFPLFPGIAGLAAMVWLAWITSKLPWRLPKLSPLKTLATLVIIWLVAKLVFVHVVTPNRNRDREPRAKGELLARLVPNEQTLYLSRLKDEGIMFYFGRQVRRLPSFSQLPPSTHAVQYGILDVAEWRKVQAVAFAQATLQRLIDPESTPRQPCQIRTGQIIARLSDEQGDPILLIRFAR